VFRTFDPVSIQLSLDSSNVQHERIVLKLVKPEILNFSVPSITASTVAVQQPQKNPLEPCDSPCEPQPKKAKI